MIRTIDILSAKNVFILTLLFIAIGLLFLVPKSAVNVDEQLHYPHAQKVVNWYFTGGEDISCLETTNANLKYYGQSVDNFTALFNRVFEIENEFLVRHFTGAIFFWLLLLFTGLIAFQLSGSYWVSLITVLSMVFMPRLFGQAFGNLKDIPFAAGYMAGIFMSIRFFKELPNPRWITSILLGLSIAFTSSVRIGGLILFAYVVLFIVIFFVLKPFGLKQIVSTKPSFVRLMGQLAVIISIGYFIGLLFWPYALQNVFVHPLESLGVMEHYKVSIRQVFEGNLLWSTQLPWYYLPKWLMISTPEFVILGFLIFSVLFIQQLYKKNSENLKQLYFEFFLLFVFLFPAIYVICIDSNLYSGVRQMIFILPSLAILTSLGIYKWLKLNISRKIKYPVAVFFFVLMIFPLQHQAKTFPADYIYFNSLAGGNKKAWSNYEYDYYFHGIKKPAAYLTDMVKNRKNVVVASNCNLSNYFNKSSNITYKYVRYLERSSIEWDYALFGVNYIHPDLLKNNNWQSTEIIKTFYHKDNPIVVLLKRKKNVLDSTSQLEFEDQPVAVKKLEEAIRHDPNNVWLYVQMAKISLSQNDIESFNRYLLNGRKIYQKYEPFYLLEAQYLYTNDNFVESYNVLEELIRINPRYNPAAPLLKAVKEKLNI